MHGGFVQRLHQLRQRIGLRQARRQVLERLAVLGGQFAGALQDDVRLAQDEGHRAKIAGAEQDRKSTRLNSSHSQISYAVFCLKKKKKQNKQHNRAHCRNPIKVNSCSATAPKTYTMNELYTRYSDH